MRGEDGETVEDSGRRRKKRRVNKRRRSIHC